MEDINDKTLAEQAAATQKAVDEKKAATVEVKKEEATVEAPQQKTEEAPLVEAKDEKSLEELLGGEEPKGETITPEPEEKKQETVPLSVHLEIKNELKELRRMMKDKVVSGDEVEEIAETLAEKYDTSSDFIKDLLSTSLPMIEKRLDEKYSKVIKKQEVERAEEKKDKLFGQLFDSVMSNNPDLKDVVNKEVIKKLALDPANSKKKLTEIIKEVYGNVKTTGTKKSFDGYQPTGDKGDIDFTNADPEQMKLVGQDKKLRKEFGDHLVKNIPW